VFSQPEASFAARAGGTIPSISTACPQAWRRFAQVIHTLMHRRPGRSPAAGLAAGSRPARPGMRDTPAGPDARTGVDEIAQEGTGARRRLQDRQRCIRRLPAGHAHLNPVRRRVAARPGGPGRSSSRLRLPQPRPGTRRPPPHARFRSPARDRAPYRSRPRPWRWRISRRYWRAVGCRQDILAGQKQAGPLHV